MRGGLASFADIAVGDVGVMWERRYSPAGDEWHNARSCIVTELDRREDGRVWSLHVRDMESGKMHKVFSAKGQKTPGVWRNMQMAAKSANTLIKVRLE